jgi:tripartite ATP-independent transporter DctM subunit
MDPTIVGAIWILVLLVLVFSGLPIGFALGTIGFVGMISLGGFQGALGVLTSVPYSSVANYLWTTVPLFILMGHFAYTGGLVTDLYSSARKWLGWLPGGLCAATTVGCAGFAAATGSSVACAGTMGKVALPEMTKFGYDTKLSTGTVAASGTLGSLIPPSTFMIIYGMVTETSVGKLFIAGLIPGILSALIYMAMIVVRASINPKIAPRYAGVTWKERILALKGVLGILIIAIVVLGGIYTGIWTPTEAGATGAMSTLLLCVLQRRITFKKFSESLTETARSTAALFVIIIGSMIFVAFMAVSRIPGTLGTFIVDSGFPRTGVLAGTFAMYVFLGCFMEPIGMMLLTLPVIFPTLMALGFHPIWFGILMIKFSEIGMITPPVGMNVYVINGVLPDVRLEEIFKGIFPFLMMDILTLALLIIFPQLSLWLPSLMR